MMIKKRCTSTVLVRFRSEATPTGFAGFKSINLQGGLGGSRMLQSGSESKTIHHLKSKDVKHLVEQEPLGRAK